MRRLIVTIIAVVLAALIIAPLCSGQNVPNNTPGPMYMGRPLSYWVQSIRNRDPETMDLAFDAIRDLGPAAWPAIPELVRIMKEPFDPIKLGIDGPGVILAKVRDIQLRSDAIDGLASIGDAAAPSADLLIQWALAKRVVPNRTSNNLLDKVFIDLVAMDIIERMRVAGAIAELGPGAGPAVAELVRSSDGESRKLGVAILSGGAIPIAVDLLKSFNCDDRRLGIAILIDMWPVVAKEHLTELKNTLICQDAN